MEKNAKKDEKVSRPGLYKKNPFVQERPSIKKRAVQLFVDYLLPFGTWPNAVNCHQTRPNAKVFS